MAVPSSIEIAILTEVHCRAEAARAANQGIILLNQAMLHETTMADCMGRAGYLKAKAP
jgi:hypothetical protein